MFIDIIKSAKLFLLLTLPLYEGVVGSFQNDWQKIDYKLDIYMYYFRVWIEIMKFSQK